MSFNFELDSLYRDVVENPSPFNFRVNTIDFRRRTPIMVHSVMKHQSLKEQSNFFSVRLHELIIPYDASFLLQPRLYVELHWGKDCRVVSTNNKNIRMSVLSCTIKNIQTNAANAPVYIIYNSSSYQTIQVEDMQKDLTVKIYDRTGTTPNLFNVAPDITDPTKQVILSMEMTPVFYDGRYNNVTDQLSIV